MALMLRSLRPLKPAVHGALPMIFQSKTETWSRLAMQRMEQMRKTTVMKRCLATNVNPRRRDDSIVGIHKMDRILQELDIEVRRTGRIAKRNVLEIIDEMQSSGNVTNTQSLLLIRCCGSLLAAEFPEHRIELLNKVLELLKSSKVAFDISHYNAILKIHLENGCKFSPTEFLANMESENIEPNRVTYQRLVSYYCQQGDINGASKILEFMKSKNLPINENIFNALVEGHVKQGDIDNAKAILNVMRSAKLEPTSATYLNLICGYAVKGDLKEINNLLTEAESNDAGLSDKDILEVIYTLAVNGHSQHVDEMMTKLVKRFGYNQEIITMIYRLINNQQDDVAFKLLSTMRNNPEAEPIQSGQFFIRQLVKVERPFDKILHYCDELKNQNLNSVGILQATESCFILKNPGYALRFINVLQERGIPVRPHYFWPILVCYKNDISRIFEILQTMVNMNCSPNYETILDHVLPYCNITDVEEMIERLKNVGVNNLSILNAMIAHLLRQKKLNSAVNIVRTYPVRLIMGYNLLFPLAEAAAELRDLPSALMILKKFDVTRDEGEKTDWGGLFLREYFKQTDYNSQKLEELLISFKENQVSITSNAASFAKSKFRGNVPSAINDLLDGLVSSNFGQQPSGNISHTEDHESDIDFRQMSLADLEKYYADQKSNNKNVRGVLRKLFFAYSRSGDFEKTMQVKSELDGLGFIYSASMYVALLILYVRNDLLDKALECEQKLKEVDPNFSLDDSKCLKFAGLLIKNGRYDDAINILISRSELHGVKQKPDELKWDSLRLLNAAADTKNAEVVSRFSDLLFDKGFAEPNSSTLGPLVKVQLLKGNIDEALKIFENCCQKYSCTPWKSDLLTYFIKQEDAVRLQRVVDLSSDVHGEMNALYDLAYIFIINDQFKQARKILETPGLRAKGGRLIHMCDGLINDNKISHLEQLVTITKGIFDSDRDEMYFQLLRGYGKLGDTEKALGVWTLMQEENVHPRNRTLVFLSDLLKSHNKPVPFTVDSESTVPPMVPHTRIESSPNRKNHVDVIKNLITNGEVDRAISLRNKYEAELSATEVFVIVEALVLGGHLQEAFDLTKDHLPKNNDVQIRIFTFLLSKLAAGGKVDEILSFRDKLSTKVKFGSHYDNYLAKSYVTGNRVEEWLQWLETDFPRDQISFPNRNLLDVLINSPEYSDKIQNLATSFAANNNTRPLNVMWNYYFIQEDYEKADEIYKSTLSLQDKFMFIDVIREAKANTNEKMARKLLDVVKSSQMNNKLKCLAYGGLIDILNEKADPTNALQVYNEACKANIETALFKHSTLLGLKKGLEKQEVPVPATITSQLEILNRKGNQSSDSSSDSSDDDDEKTRR